MCYSTAYWANIRQVFYAASWSDYDDLFSDRAINDDIRRPMPQKEIRMIQILQSEAQAVWTEFRQLPDGVRYRASAGDLLTNCPAQQQQSCNREQR